MARRPWQQSRIREITSAALWQETAPFLSSWYFGWTRARRQCTKLFGLRRWSVRHRTPFASASARSGTQLPRASKPMLVLHAQSAEYRQAARCKGKQVCARQLHRGGPVAVSPGTINNRQGSGCWPSLHQGNNPRARRASLAGAAPARSRPAPRVEWPRGRPHVSPGHQLRLAANRPRGPRRASQAGRPLNGLVPLTRLRRARAIACHGVGNSWYITRVNL